MQESVKVLWYAEMNTHTHTHTHTLNIPLSIYLIVLLALHWKGLRKFALHVDSVNMYIQQPTLALCSHIAYL
jgi:hypothetical protein